MDRGNFNQTDFEHALYSGHEVLISGAFVGLRYDNQGMFQNVAKDLIHGI